MAGLLLLMLLAPLASVVGAEAASDGDSADLVWSAKVNGRWVSRIDSGDPLELGPGRPLRIVLRMTNATEAPLPVEDVRLEGRVMGIAFFRFGAGLDVVLRPDETVRRTVTIDVTELSRQAVGSLPAELQLIGEDREVLASRGFPVQVNGELLSAYGLFGLAALVITGLIAGSIFLAIWQEQLPENAWVRGLQFAVAGLGVGLTLTVYLSITRLLTPDPDAWLPVVFGCVAVAFAVGYLLPGVRRLGRQPATDDDDLDEPPPNVVPTGSRVGQHGRLPRQREGDRLPQLSRIRSSLRRRG